MADIPEQDPEANGWNKISALPEDARQYFFTMFDHTTNQGLVIGNGNHQGNDHKTMWYQTGVEPEEDKGALWTFDAFDGNNYSGARGVETSYLIITNASYADICMQSYDGDTWFYRTDNNGEGWTDRAYVIPTYLLDSGWRLRNYKGGNDQYIGRWDGSDEVAGNTNGSNLGNYDIYAILRGQYVGIAEAIDEASEDNPIDITYVIANPDGTRKNNFHASQPIGWTVSQDDASEIEYANYLPAKVGDSYFNKWQGSGNITDRSMSQKVTGLPSGRYRLKVKTSASVVASGAYLFANTNNTQLNTVNGEDGEVTVVTNVSDGTLEFGVRLQNYQSNNCKFDHFTLEYLGRKPGDVDANGTTDLSDLQKLVLYFVGKTADGVVNPDVNRDGIESLKDIVTLINFLIQH